MDLEVVGRHALLFDDDAMAAFVNSGDALVDWNSLQIDRYDVRHLLSAAPPRRRTQSSPHLVDSLELELDQERYLDLPPPSDEPEAHEGGSHVDAGSYRAVSFSYGSTDDYADQKNADGEARSGFHPSFPVPQSLLKSLPPTEKVHQIIARTATFVSKHGGQSEIVLRVKQGNNPTFGFLMPDHHLHPYFRFLVDNQELLQSDVDGKPQIEERKTTTDGVGGALSLLGSVYGLGEEEDNAVENAVVSEPVVSDGTLDARGAAASNISEKAKSSENAQEKSVEASLKPLSSNKEKIPAIKKNTLISASKSKFGSTRLRKEDDTRILAAGQKSKNTLGVTSKVRDLVVEPPPDLKRMVEKIVEYVMKNGEEFEATLIQQDSQHGRFPFLLPSNQYHPYYLKVLQQAQSKGSGKSSRPGKDDSIGHGLDKKASLSKENESLSLESAGIDIPYEPDRREKFRMVIGKLKDPQDAPSRATEQEFGVRVDAAAAAAILQAATRGIKTPDLGIFSNLTLNGNNHRPSSEDSQGPRSGDIPSSQFNNITGSREQSILIPGHGMLAAKSVASEAANEADSPLTNEKKLKAERLRKAKMFVAMLKSGGAPFRTEQSRGLSAEPQDSVVQCSDGDVNVSGKETPPLDVSRKDRDEMHEKKHFLDEHNEWRSRRKYRSRSGRHEDEEGASDEEMEQQYSRKKQQCSSEGEDRGKGDEEVKEQKRHKRKHRSRRSSQGDEDGRDKEQEKYKRHTRKKHRSRRSLNEGDDDKEKNGEEGCLTKKRHKSRHSSRDDRDDRTTSERDQMNSKKHHRSHNSSHHSKGRHKHRTRDSSGGEESRERHRHINSSGEEYWQHNKSNEDIKESTDREELEEGEISSKVSDQSRSNLADSVSTEASLDISHQRASAQPPEIPQVSDDLRAKIRAMLMANR